MITSEWPLDDDRGVEVKIVTSWDEEAIRSLYQAGGWWKNEWQVKRLNELIRASYAFVIAYHRDSAKTVGMVRAISDGMADAYIQDLVVLPEFRGYGVGKRLVKELIRHCSTRGITWIALIAEPGTSGFYMPLGFIRMEHFIPMMYLEEKNYDQ